MKKTISLVLIIALGYWLLPQEKMEQLEDYFNEKKPLSSINISSTNTSKQQVIIEKNIDNKFIDQGGGIISPQDRDKKIAVIQSELNDLIEQYNKNISDREAKHHIQLKMDKLLKSYNELALPVALAKINEV